MIQDQRQNPSDVKDEAAGQYLAAKLQKKKPKKKTQHLASLRLLIQIVIDVNKNTEKG